MQLLILPTGSVACIYSEELNLLSLGPLAIARASHVEPNSQGLWQADLSPVAGPLLGPFRLRSEALAAEIAWLEQNLHRLAQPTESPAGQPLISETI